MFIKIESCCNWKTMYTSCSVVGEARAACKASIYIHQEFIPLKQGWLDIEEKKEIEIGETPQSDRRREIPRDNCYRYCYLR